MFYLYHKLAWYQRRPEEGVRLQLQPVTEITDNCELLGGYCEQNRASLEKQSVRLTRLDGERHWKKGSWSQRDSEWAAPSLVGTHVRVPCFLE